MQQGVYEDSYWFPINGTGSEESEMYSSIHRLNETFDVINASRLSSFNTNTNSDSLIDPTVQSVGRTIQNELEIANLDGLMAFIGPNSVVEMTVTSMASNIIVAFGWIIIGKWLAGGGCLKKLAYVLLGIVSLPTNF